MVSRRLIARPDPLPFGIFPPSGAPERHGVAVQPCGEGCGHHAVRRAVGVQPEDGKGAQGASSSAPPYGVRLSAAMRCLSCAVCSWSHFKHARLLLPQVSDPNKKNRWLAIPLLLFQVFVLRPVLIAQMKKDGEPGEAD